MNFSKIDRLQFGKNAIHVDVFVVVVVVFDIDCYVS